MHPPPTLLLKAPLDGYRRLKKSLLVTLTVNGNWVTYAASYFFQLPTVQQVAVLATNSCTQFAGVRLAIEKT